MNRAALPLLAGFALLAGCAQTPPPQRASTARTFSVDERGAARQCTAPAPVIPASGSTTEAAMTVVNDGGWCGLLVARPGPQPFTAPLLTVRPQRGRLLAHAVGDHTRLTYTPDPGTSGTDAFAVRLLPDNTVVRVAVTVEPGAAPVQPAAATPPTPPAAPARATPAPARRTSPAPARRQTQPQQRRQ